MSRQYKIELIDNFNSCIVTKTFTADDVQIKPDSVKFLNGKGAAATVVAYFPGHNVVSVEAVPE